MPINQMEFFEKSLLENNIILPQPIREHCLQYLHLMREWNRIFNLTSIRDPKEMVMLHLVDSLVIRPYLHGERMIDVGSGAGLPGIPLALAEPDKQFVLLDSNHKKTRFLTQAVLELKLKNVKIVHQRTEEFRDNDKFDSILSRAFSSLQVMLDTTEHLVGEQGQFLAMKGTYPIKEIEDIPSSFKLIAVHKLMIKGLDAERHLVCLRK